MHDSELMQQARTAREHAFAPYSDYAVGAAILTDKGVFTGANIEVSGRSTSIHAEMFAVFNAVYAGATEYRTLAVSPKGLTGVAICGLCQHTLAQFTDNLRILEDIGDDDPVEYELKELTGVTGSPGVPVRAPGPHYRYAFA